MNTRDLDRLVSGTEITPVSKVLLRHVRKAVVDGRAGEAVVGEYSWSIALDGDGTPFRFSFSMKRRKRAG